MTDDELTDLECAILDACAEAKRNGWRIVTRLTIDTEGMRCCPIAALAGPDKLARTGGSTLHAAAKLATLPKRAANTFVFGFDGAFKSRGSLYAMGRRFRERLEDGSL